MAQQSNEGPQLLVMAPVGKKKKNQNLVEMKNMTRRAIELHAENGTCLDLSLYFTCASSRVWDQDGWIVPWESN